MHRIDHPTADTASGVNLFTSGNPGGGVPATNVTPEWLNDVQENILHVLEQTAVGSGAKGRKEDLFDALAELISAASVPIGSVIAYDVYAPPLGVLEQEGSSLPRAAYPLLFTHAQASGMFDATGADIGRYGPGDGATTFTLPDMRGEFLRGWDHGRGVDPGRELGAFQADELRSHQHAAISEESQTDGTGGDRFGGLDNSSTNETLFTEFTGGVETRPRNVAKMIIVRAL